MNFVLKRCAGSAIQLAVLSVAAFLLFRLLPGDIYSTQLADPQVSPASVDALRASQGLNRSWPVRYLDWVKSAAEGNWGMSLAYGIPVSDLLGPRIRKTLQIAVPALIFAWLVGLAAAFFSARWRVGQGLESSVATAAMIPDVAAVSLMLWLAVWAGASISGAWLPILGLSFTLAPVVFLHASAELSRAQDLEFVRLARLRGIQGRQLWLRYILPASANPLVSLAGLSLAAAIGSSFLVEVLTGWPGLGPMFLEAVQSRDYPIVQTVLVLLAAVLTLSNLLADLALYRLDPRIRISQ